MKQPLKIKDWLQERSEKPQFKIIPKQSHTDKEIVCRLKDGVFFVEDDTVTLKSCFRDDIKYAECQIIGFQGNEISVLLQLKEGEFNGFNIHAPINDIEHKNT